MTVHAWNQASAPQDGDILTGPSARNAFTVRRWVGDQDGPWNAQRISTLERPRFRPGDMAPVMVQIASDLLPQAVCRQAQSEAGSLRSEQFRSDSGYGSGTMGAASIMSGEAAENHGRSSVASDPLSERGLRLLDQQIVQEGQGTPSMQEQAVQTEDSYSQSYPLEAVALSCCSMEFRCKSDFKYISLEP